MSNPRTDKVRTYLDNSSGLDGVNSLSLSAHQQEENGDIKQTWRRDGTVTVQRFGLHEFVFAGNYPGDPYSVIGSIGSGGTSGTGGTGGTGGTSGQKCPDHAVFDCPNSIDPGTSWQFVVSGGVKGIVFRWQLISGGGTINPATGLYTAPAAGADCLSPAVIGLLCNTQLLGTCSIKIGITPCSSEDIHIAFTTQQMHCNDTQDLVASYVPSDKTCGDQFFSWSLSGGGHLDRTFGQITTYTAPNSNENCAANPTITLKCNGAIQDSLTLSINAVASSGVAYYDRFSIKEACAMVADGVFICAGTCQQRVIGGTWAGCCALTANDCEDNVLYTESESCIGNQSNETPHFWCDYYYTEGCSTPQYTSDQRTVADKAAGCCPAGLL
jgi:hypothetical protein